MVVIKPDAISKAEQIKEIAEHSGFYVNRRKDTTLTADQASVNDSVLVLSFLTFAGETAVPWRPESSSLRLQWPYRVVGAVEG